MPTLVNATELLAKQKLRMEINEQISNFLVKGGRIEVLDACKESTSSARFGVRPALAELTGPFHLDTE